MNRAGHRRTTQLCVAILILALAPILRVAVADQNPTQPGTQPASTSPPLTPSPPQQPAAGGLKIAKLLVAPSGDPASGKVSLNSKLAVVLSGPPPHPGDQYVLFLNGREIKGLEPAIYTSLKTGDQALVFKLVRNSDNDPFWKELLGAPKRFQLPVVVGLGERTEPCTPSQPCKTPDVSITGGDTTPAAFEFLLITWTWLSVATFAVIFVIGLVWGHARKRATLRDSLLPQLPANLQPYSLGRWQMSFWFVLIFASFLFLYILLWDYNTVSTQALALMGISSATALAAVAVDEYKDSPADAVNRALQALGLNSYDDVLRIKVEIASKQTELKGPPIPTADRIKQLQLEIQDRCNLLRIYEDKTKPFMTQGWFRDLTTDLNGTALHRIQVLCWTIALGLVFLVGVYRDLAMPPDFSATLLALMGISSAGYVGFKFPEKNN